MIQKPTQKLISAAEVGNVALVKRLLKKGADVHFVENKEVRIHPFSRKCAHILTFHYFTNLQLGYNALHYAAFNGHKEVIEVLISAGADVNVVTTVSPFVRHIILPIGTTQLLTLLCDCCK